MVIERKYSTKHEHLVEYLDNSLTQGAHPLPIGEKIDEYYHGIKVSCRIYWEGGSYCIITSKGTDVTMKIEFPEDITTQRIIEAYNPYSVINNYWKERK